MILSIIILIIVICVLSVKLMRINAKSLSRDAFKSAAYKQANLYQYKDPIITCDYCGSKIDTSKDDKCPNCGAAYDRDKEWNDRRDIDVESIEKQADRYAENKLNEAKRDSAKIAKKLKACIVILASILLILITLAIVISVTESGHDYVKDEKINEYSYENYVKEDYSIDENNVLIDECGLKISITGFYYDEESKDAKIEYLLENNSDEPLNVAFACVGVNNKAKDGYYTFFYNWIKKGDKVTIYDRIYDLEEKEIKNLTYSELSISNEDGNLYDNDKCIKFVTNSKQEINGEMPSGDLLYEDHNISIIKTNVDDNHFYFAIVNNSDNDYFVTSTDMRINNTEEDSARLYKEAIPSQHTMENSIYIFDETKQKIATSDIVDISFSFECLENPANNFSTGYIKIN